MGLSEVATFLTDLILCLQAAFYAQILYRRRQSVWASLFVSIAFAALTGALYHGFQDQWPEFWLEIIKRGPLLGLHGAAFFLAWLLVNLCLPQGSFLRKVLFGFFVLKALFFLAWSMVEPRFVKAIADYGSSFLFMSVLLATSLRRHPIRRDMMWGLGISVAAAIVQIFKIAPHPRFNHNDLYHVIQMTGLHFFYRASQHAEKRQKPNPLRS